MPPRCRDATNGRKRSPGTGIGVVAVGALWGNCNWDGGDVNINTNFYNSIEAERINLRVDLAQGAGCRLLYLSVTEAF